MNNLKLKNKILLILILPVLSIIVLSIISLSNKHEEKNSIQKTYDYLEFTIKINSFLHELQKERSYSLYYISSYGNSYKEKLEEQKALSNKEFNNLIEYLKGFNLSNYDSKVEKNLKILMTDFKNLKEIRNKIVLLQLDEKSVKKFYEKLIFIQMSFFDDLVTFSSNGDVSKYSESIIALVNTIEKAYDESIILRTIFDKGRISSNDYFDFSSFVTAQNTYLHTFKTIAQKEELDFYNKIVSNVSNKEVERLREIVFFKNSKDVILSSMKEKAGYGGLIHNYKNYVLRGDRKYLKKVEQMHVSLIRDIKKYKRLKNVTREEKKLLKNIKRVFDSYLLSASELKVLIDKGYTINQLDEYVRISDKKAIESINKLSKNIFGADIKTWEKVSFQRVENFIRLQDKVSANLMILIDQRTDEINQSFILLISLIILVIVLIFISLFFMTKRIVNTLQDFKEGLESFLLYVIREKEDLNPIPVEGKDEFAQMTNDMNEQIVKIRSIIEQDKKVVLELSNVVEKVSNGFLNYQIHEKGATNEVETLRQIINSMIQETYNKICNLNSVLDGYATGKYNTRLKDEQKNGLYGDFGTLFSGSVLLGQSISQLVAMITNAGKELEENTIVLSKSSSNLSQRANEQASALEETAASIEQITSNMQSSNEDVEKMLNISDELNTTAVTGNELASKTSTSMEEINEKVTAISEAISVIDQIAFQTNILSLNAAVEAATAGEAGKGFAVVAQEVRNLASRSAEAANTIKKLVEEATYKSNEGKSIANDMITGYDELSSKIVDNKEIIDSVSSAIKEQEEGMIQVNEAVGQIDRMTQENASTSADIGNLSNQVATLSSRLLGITDKTQITDKYYDMVDDIDLIQLISKFKNNNINFKKEYFSDLDSYKRITIIKNEDTELGQWIIQSERNQEVYVDSKEWKRLKNRKIKFHELMQEFVDLNANKASNDQLRALAKDIEIITAELFSSLNDIAVVNTKLLKD